MPRQTDELVCHTHSLWEQTVENGRVPPVYLSVKDIGVLGGLGGTSTTESVEHSFSGEHIFLANLLNSRCFSSSNRAVGLPLSRLIIYPRSRQTLHGHLALEL